jgi:biotin synthase
MDIRHDWSLPEVRALHELPLFDLIDRARAIHREAFPAGDVQLCSLLSIKTGGCPEDCGYCPQAARYHAGVEAQPLLQTGEVLAAARAARDAGATRFCMGAAWREPKDGDQFDRVLDMVRGVRALGLEACCTLGMLSGEQARKLKEAGCTAYNHNLDTSRSAYPSIISTREYDDRLRTLRNVREAGITICSGGIIGMGESIDDRCDLLRTLAAHDPHPESVPINMLVRVAGTPLGERPPASTLEMVRMIATARILMPRAMVRLSAGRLEMTDEAQLLCLFAGANSIFVGERLLTTGNPTYEQDLGLLAAAGIEPMRPRT